MVDEQPLHRVLDLQVVLGSAAELFQAVHQEHEPGRFLLGCVVGDQARDERGHLVVELADVEGELAPQLLNEGPAAGQLPLDLHLQRRAEGPDTHRAG